MNQFQIHFSRSTDHGRTWSKPVPRPPRRAVGRQAEHGASSADGQDVYVQFNGPTGGDVYSSMSHDGGATWSTDADHASATAYYFDYGGAVLPDGRVVFAQISFSYTGPDGAARGRADDPRVRVRRRGRDLDRARASTQLQLGRECTSRSCYGDFYDSGPALAADEDGDLVIVYNGASEHFGPQAVFARSSHRRRAHLDRPRARSRWPASTRPSPPPPARATTAPALWFMAQRNAPVEGLVPDDERSRRDLERAREDLGRDIRAPSTSTRTASTRCTATTARSRSPATGNTVAVWGEGKSYYGPGGVWFNRQR